MAWLVWIGAALALGGIVAIVASLLRVLRARRAGLDDAALRDRVRTAMPLNFVGLALSTLGLMMVIVGVTLD